METGKTQQRSREQTTPICCDHWNIFRKPGFMRSILDLRLYLLITKRQKLKQWFSVREMAQTRIDQNKTFTDYKHKY